MTSMKRTLIAILLMTTVTLLLAIYLFVYQCNYYESIPDTEIYTYSYENYVSDYYNERLAEIEKEHLEEEKKKAEEFEKALKTLKEVSAEHKKNNGVNNESCY